MINSYIYRPGHKILSKFQVQGQVAIFIFKPIKSEQIGWAGFQAYKKQAQARISSFKKVQARTLCVNQAQAIKTRIKQFNHCAKNPKNFEF